MELKVVNGQLELGSIFKLCFTGWLVAWSLIMAIAVIGFLIADVLSGDVVINGETVTGVSVVTSQIIPFLLLLPIIVLLQSAFIAVVTTFGVWLYLQKFPISWSIEPAR